MTTVRIAHAEPRPGKLANAEHGIAVLSSAVPQPEGVITLAKATPERT